MLLHNYTAISNHHGFVSSVSRLQPLAEQVCFSHHPTQDAHAVLQGSLKDHHSPGLEWVWMLAWQGSDALWLVDASRPAASCYKPPYGSSPQEVHHLQSVVEVWMPVPDPDQYWGLVVFMYGGFQILVVYCD